MRSMRKAFFSILLSLLLALIFALAGCAATALPRYSLTSDGAFELAESNYTLAATAALDDAGWLPVENTQELIGKVRGKPAYRLSWYTSDANRLCLMCGSKATIFSDAPERPQYYLKNERLLCPLQPQELAAVQTASTLCADPKLIAELAAVWQGRASIFKPSDMQALETWLLYSNDPELDGWASRCTVYTLKNTYCLSKPGEAACYPISYELLTRLRESQ